MLSRFNQLPRLILAALMACGVGITWAVVIGIATDAIVERLFGRSDTEEILIRSDAVVIHSFLNRSDGPVNTYRFADGQPVALGDLEKWKHGTWLMPSSFRGPPEDEADFVPPPWDYRLARFWFSGRDQSRWYLVHDALAEGHAYFVGYDAATKELLGYVGKDGFVATLPPHERQFPCDGRPLVSRRFTSNVISRTNSGHYDYASRRYEQANLPEWSVYLLSRDEVWHVDLRERHVDLLGQFPDTIDLDLAPPPADSRDKPNGIDEKLMLRTKSEMIKLDLDGELLHRWPLPGDARAKGLIYCYDLGKDNMLISFGRRMLDRSLENELIWLDTDGNISKRETVETLQGGLEPHELWMMGPALPMPTLLTLAFTMSAGEVRGPDYSSKFTKALALFWPAISLVYLVAAVLAWLAYRRQTRFALPGAGAWAIFVFLLGVPGWLAYRLHRRWPVMKACDQCQRSAPRDRDTCAACGHLFAPPSRLGTEVFA